LIVAVLEENEFLIQKINIRSIGDQSIVDLGSSNTTRLPMIMPSACYEFVQAILKGTIDLLFDWFGLVCFANKNKNCLLSYN
jgi:hypothetical protein